MKRLILTIQNSDYSSQNDKDGADYAKAKNFLAGLGDNSVHSILPTPRRFAALVVVRQATIAVPRFRLNVNQTVFDNTATAIH